MARPRKNKLEELPEILSFAITSAENGLWKSLRIQSKGNLILKVEESEPNLKGIISQRLIDEISSKERNV